MVHEEEGEGERRERETIYFAWLCEREHERANQGQAGPLGELMYNLNPSIHSSTICRQ